ncbi:unnamed protein product [Heligmosomoides polygyrus]|uniref:Piezo_RRas_bdg domain-containing protein n=1 Tax=Heligmosomoides polygyrus TaxID=6339 RepID=A0A183FDF3_HELPZ|nr:unnamed protein product [Heligmosomoides polygyrus]
MLLSVLQGFSYSSRWLVLAPRGPSDIFSLPKAREPSPIWLLSIAHLNLCFRFHAGDGFESAMSILPEIVAFVASLLTVIIAAVLAHRNEDLEVVGTVRVPGRKGRSRSLLVALKRFSNVAIIVLSALVGCVQPSILNCIYFLAFLFVATWWALYKPLRHTAYNKVKKVSVLVVNMAYVGRGRTKLFCIIFLISLQIFYHVLMLQLLWTYHGSRNYVDDTDGGSSVHEEVGPAGSSSTHRQPRIGGRGYVLLPILVYLCWAIFFETLGSVYTSTVAQYKHCLNPSVGEHPNARLRTCRALQVWALLYHSIFGLILLLMACTLWVFKDSRGASFAMAPTITMYVEVGNPYSLLFILQSGTMKGINIDWTRFRSILRRIPLLTIRECLYFCVEITYIANIDPTCYRSILWVLELLDDAAMVPKLRP